MRPEGSTQTWMMLELVWKGGRKGICMYRMGGGGEGRVGEKGRNRNAET